jgi:hypothetical protein
VEAQLLSHLFNASMACFWKHSAPHSRAERRESANPLAAGGFDLDIVMRSREREGSHDAQNGSDFPSIIYAAFRIAFSPNPARQGGNKVK